MEALPPSLSDKAYLYFLTNTDHVERLVSFHLVFHTQVNLSHPLNSIESSYRARAYCEHLKIFNCKGITSAFHLLSSLQTTKETSRTPLPKNKNIKTFCKVSWSQVRLALYYKVTFGNIWLDGCISIHFILETEEREDVNKYACWVAGYYLIVNPLITMVINFGCTPSKPIESLALAHGVIIVGFCPINEHFAGSLIMWQIIE